MRTRPMPEPLYPVRLTLPTAVGTLRDEVVLEPGHLERLFQAALFAAVRNGLLAPGEEAVARLLPGTVRAMHGQVLCLDSCRIEVARPSGLVVTVIEFGMKAFAGFALARAVHLAHEAQGGFGDVVFALHAVATDDACTLTVPALPVWSVDALRTGADATGTPSLEWIVTFMTPAVTDGLAELALSSRQSGVE